MTALLLLQPSTPMLFQGEEFASSAPFYYFADHEPRLSAQVRTGRSRFLSQFSSLAYPGALAVVADPGDEAAYRRCKLDHGERERHAAVWLLHRDLLRLRRDDPVIAGRGAHGFDGAMLGPEAFVLRWISPEGADRLLLVNLGRPLHLERAPEPLLAPPLGFRWRLAWTSEDPMYGGSGIPPIETPENNWYLVGNSAVLLTPEPDAPAAG
jgi:maltooligosyltrehalose trehalohydrolase